MSWDPLSLAVLSVSFVWMWTMWRSNQLVGRLPMLPAAPTQPERSTTLSVIITACNEADTIEPALTSLLSQTLPGLELVAVNDRSSDETGTILDRLALADARLRVIHISDLPEGWLGKVHAMHQGTQLASGDWIVYTDADVHFSADVLGRALAEAESQGLDHLTMLPTIVTSTALVDVSVVGFAQALFFTMKLGTSDPLPFGAGAFNMVRRTTLEKSEGLEWLKMEVADDTGLAFLIVNAGGQSGFRMALDGLQLQWYPSLPAMFRGLEKNSYLLVSRGNPLRMIALLLGGLIALALPWLGMVLQPSLAATLAGGLAMMLYMGVTLRLRLILGTRPWAALLAPLGFVILGAIGLWSMTQTLRRGGINWRGTFYPMNKLIEGQRVKV